MTQLSLEELTAIAKKFTKDEYDIELNIPIVVNNRLRTSLGRFCQTGQGISKRIDLSGKLLTYAHRKIAIAVVKHEAVHYALHKLKKAYKDGDQYFESELKRLQLPSSVDKNRRISYVGEIYVFKCVSCHKQVKTTVKRVRSNSKRYVSSCCQDRLDYVRTDILDGTINGKCLFLDD